MKKIFIPLVLITISLLGCTKPSAIVYDNPNDPSNQDFSNPTVAITQGPAEGSTVTNTTVTFSWQGAGSAVEYSYALDGYLWSSWSSQSACTTSSVYEGGRTFNVKARNEKQQEGPVSTRNFTVNNVSGPALMMSPRTASVNVGTSIYVYCMLEEIGKPVMGANLVISYPSSKLDVVSIDTVGCIWTSNNGTYIGPYAIPAGAGVLDYSVSVAGGAPAGINPVRGSILRICFRGKVAGLAAVSYSAASALRDTLNNPITPFGRYGCTITVK